MKKLIIPAAALLLFAVVSNAQVTQKQPAQTKPVPASHVSSVTKPMTVKKATSPAAATAKTPAAAKTNTIHKKHHPKKHKAAAKKG